MNDKTILFLILLLPGWCMGQTTDSLYGKALYKDAFYLGNMLYGSANPTSLSNSPYDVMDFNFHHQRANGDFHLIDEGGKEQGWIVGMEGIRRINKLSFDGGIGYQNLAADDKKWNSSLYVDPENPYILADSIIGDNTAEKFKIYGGMSYQINPRWRAAIRVSYDVGVLADQTDPRPETQGMIFGVNPGVDFRINDSFTIGVSGKLNRKRETVKYTIVDYLNTKTDFIFLMRGMANPEVYDALGYTRKILGTEYAGNVQLLWTGKKFSNFTEIGISSNLEEAEDGSSEFLYLGGDYQATNYTLQNRLQGSFGRFTHNITVKGDYKMIEGTWYIQQARYDDEGTQIWDIKDESVAYKKDIINASVNYRLDIMQGDIPSFTCELEGAYSNWTVDQYPELYNQEAGIAYIDALATKHILLKKGMLSLSANGKYNIVTNETIDVEGAKLGDGYIKPAFYALAADYYSIGGKIAYKRAIKVSGQPLLFDIYLQSGTSEYKGDFSSYVNKNRHFLDCGIHLIF